MKFVDVIKKKIMVQNIGNAKQQISVNTFTLENRIHIGSFATKFVGKPGNRTFLTLKFFLY